MNTNEMIQLETSNSEVILRPFGYVRKINCAVKDLKTNLSVELTLSHTLHSMKRTQQRGIGRDAILLAVLHGTCVEKQNFVFYVVRDKDIPSNIEHHQRKMMANLVVVLDQSETNIITCYRAKNAIKHVSRKTKYLYNAA